MSLLLDARKKVELALQHSDAHTDTGTQPATELSIEDLPAGIPQKKPDTQSHTTQRAAGKNLFAAKTAPTGGMRLGIIPIAIISGLVLAAGGGYYVWREISPPPVMQRHNPAPAPRPPEVRVSDETDDTTTSHSTRLEKDSGQVAGYGETTSHSTKLPAEKFLAGHPKDGHQAAGYKLANNTNQVAGYGGVVNNDPIANAAPPAAPHDAAAQPIRVEHVQEGDAVDPILLAAYQAYRNSDFGTALQRYSEVLRKDAQNRNTPNRDALLGMAAIAQQQSQDAVAARYYNQALMLDPRDPVANAGMSALLGTSDATATESRLKLLLAQQLHSAGTQSSALHFALGNLYAEQSRWGDAQQAYFNACNLEQGNAQFTFNLAVSLDHLGQGKLAAQHYQRALQLDLSDNPGFNRAQTQRRINELTAP